MAITDVLESLNTKVVLESLNTKTVLVAIAFVFLSHFLIGSIINYRKLKQFQGPPLAGVTSLWLFIKGVRGQAYEAEKEALAKYGSPARIAPTLLVTDDPDVVKHMSSPTSKWTRSSWYSGLKINPRFDNVFSTRNEKFHSDMKSRETGAYHGRDITTLEPDMDLRILDSIKLLEKHCTNSTFDMSEFAKFFTLDVLSTIAFGRPFGFMAADSDLFKYNEDSGDKAFVLEAAINNPTFLSILHSPIAQALGAPKYTDKAGMGPLLKFAHDAVEERYTTDEKVRKDMLNHFKEKGMSQAQCEAESYLQIIAGSDSTTGLLRCMMYAISGTPTVYMKLQAEIDQASAEGKLSEPLCTYAEAQKLPYLSACIWESLRMHPPLFGLKIKLAPPSGDTIKGIYYPPGTEIGLCDEALCRKKDIFGEDAHIFRPERWLEADVETKKKFTRTVDMIFGSGRFVCLGRHIAMMEVHKVVVEWFKRYDWALADPMKGVKSVDHGVAVVSEMRMIVRPRAARV